MARCPRGRRQTPSAARAASPTAARSWWRCASALLCRAAAGRSTTSTSIRIAPAESHDMIAIGPSGSSRAELNEEPQSATERLLESSWAQRERRASRRELAVDATAAGLFLAAAGALALAGGAAGLRPGVAALLIAVYTVVARIEFPVGAGYVVPTQLILVPMLLMLPPAVVPAAVALGLVLGAAIDWSLGRVPPRRVLSAVPDAWHAIGPALVLVLAGSPFIDFDQLPLLVAAFAAGCIVDLACSLVRMRLAGVVP